MRATLLALAICLTICSTAQTFKLVKDIYAGTTGSLPYDITDVNGTLFFTANEPSSGQELWKSDGTAAGTVLLKDIAPGASGSFHQAFVNVNGTLFFQANDGVNG